ncbi:MAG: DUF6249 domain-containing protein [Bacteroidales bacterium]|nr:DUF6249 domain-containing protein [Bacteroidales bacterium]
MKRVILMMVAVLTMICTANAKERLVYQTDSITGERLVIEVYDTMRNGHAEVDTLSITRYPAKSSSTVHYDYDDDDRDLEQLERILSNGWGIVWITLATIFAIFVLPLLIIALIFYYRHKNRKAKYELAAKMIEKGEPLPADLEESVRGLSDIESRGIKNMCIGVAVTIFIWALIDSFGLACIGLIVLANGVSQYIIARRTKETEDNVEMRKLKEEVDRLKKQQHDNAETIDTEEVNL